MKARNNIHIAAVYECELKGVHIEGIKNRKADEVKFKNCY